MSQDLECDTYKVSSGDIECDRQGATPSVGGLMGRGSIYIISYSWMPDSPAGAG